MTELVDLIPIFNQIGVGAAVLITVLVMRKIIAPIVEMKNNHITHIEEAVKDIRITAQGNSLQLGNINETLKDIRQIMREKH